MQSTHSTVAGCQKRQMSITLATLTTTKLELEFGMYPQSMPTEWTHARTLRPWQSVRLDL